jgi:hypothetical protein
MMSNRLPGDMARWQLARMMGALLLAPVVDAAVTLAAGDAQRTMIGLRLFC